MIFSFIPSRPKPIFSPITRSWLMCFVASFFLIIGIFALLDIQSDRIAYSSKILQTKIEDYYSIQEKLTQHLNFLQTQTNQLHEINKQNTSLIKAITNLFDLIPNQITINSISLKNQSLILKGITPSKEIYTFLLEAPLRAIFSESRVDFFVLPSGWYNFVSVSKINQKSFFGGKQ